MLCERFGKSGGCFREVAECEITCGQGCIVFRVRIDFYHLFQIWNRFLVAVVEEEENGSDGTAIAVAWSSGF